MKGRKLLAEWPLTCEETSFQGRRTALVGAVAAAVVGVAAVEGQSNQNNGNKTCARNFPPATIYLVGSTLGRRHS